jgi:UDP-N-acetylmuramoyl-tripeptide--D-alanyl-D-alanine ligase
MMLLSDAARALHLEPPRRDAEFLRVNTDSRKVARGDLFIAIRGERFDGNTYAATALQSGAAGVVVEHDLGLDAQIVAPDGKLALGELAAHWRGRFSLPLIAVTGSNGKTTVTQMLASIITAYAGEDAFYTHGNFNNEIGLPLTLLRLRAHHHTGVVEMGMNHPGEIAYLANIARPTVAIVNNAQREHQEFMKSVAEVAAENGSVFESLPGNGVAVINADDEFAGYWRGLAKGREVIDFGVSTSADVTARVEPALFGSHLELMTPAGNAETVLRIPGAHNVLNACGAAACALAAGIPLSAIAEGLAAFTPYQGRLQKKVATSGAVVIDDTYNANPDSVRAAIDVLAAFAGERVLVLGRMGEVGDNGPKYHQEVGAYAKLRGIQTLLAFGEETAPAVTGFGKGAERFMDIDALNTAASEFSQPGVTYLVKGSRSTRMERVVTALTGAAPDGAHH